MVKNLFISCYLLLGTSCIHSDFQGNIGVKNPSISVEKKEVYEEKEATNVAESDVDVIYGYEGVVPLAKSFVGITEVGGNNMGFSSKEYERLMREVGWKPKQSWCGYANIVIYDSLRIPHRMTAWSPTSYNRKNVIYTDGEFKKDFREGDVFSLSYQKFKNDKSRFKAIGHTGIVEKIIDEGRNVQTYEGNAQITGDGNDGGGYHRKIRPLNNSIHITRWQ